MTLHDYGRLIRHWKDHPPLRSLVAGIASALGVKFEPVAEVKHMTTEEAIKLQELTGGKILGVTGM